MRVVIVAILSLIGAYFVYTFFRHEVFKNDLALIKENIPAFFNRYRSLILSYALLKEKIISNNSLSNFENIEGYGQNIDAYYHDIAIENERKLQILKVKRPKILDKTVSFLLESDSDQFCSQIIGQVNA
jgi:hypothetical protein